MTLRLMRPSDSTTGVNTRLTPNFLNVMDGWQVGGDVELSHDKPLGIGNSPPARKVAVSPDTAVRLGSASVWMTPARSIARSVALTRALVPPVSGSVVMPCWPEMMVLLSAAPFTENGLSVLKLNTPWRMKPKEPDRLMPSCLTTSRCTSATVTLSITWSRPFTVMPLTTLVRSPTSREAMS